jgi:hypothetical protein
LVVFLENDGRCGLFETGFAASDHRRWIDHGGVGVVGR